MVHVERVDEERRCACGGEGGGNLGSHMTALAHASDDNLALTAEHHVHCLLEVVVELGYLVEDGLCLLSQCLLTEVANGLAVYVLILIGHFSVSFSLG